MCFYCCMCVMNCKYVWQRPSRWSALGVLSFLVLLKFVRCVTEVVTCWCCGCSQFEYAGHTSLMNVPFSIMWLNGNDYNILDNPSNVQGQNMLTSAILLLTHNKLLQQLFDLRAFDYFVVVISRDKIINSHIEWLLKCYACVLSNYNSREAWLR